MANAKGRFSRGSTETILDQDLLRIRTEGDIPAMIEALRLQLGRLDIDPGELEGRNARSALFKTMFLTFREDGAKDWLSSLAISLTHGGTQHRLQFHHIFPQATLRDSYRPTQINDIANLAFISGRTNRKISKKVPTDYFPELLASQGEHLFDSQCIPTDPRLLTVNAYPEFLAERRRKIANRLNRYLESARANRPAD